MAKLDTLLDNWPFTETVPDDGEAIHDLLTVIGSEFDRRDDDIAYLYKQRFLQTATSEELNRLAREAGVRRQSSEGDDELRTRALISKAATQSDGTFDSIESALNSIFDDDLTQIRIIPRELEPTIVIAIPEKLINSIPVTKSQLEKELNATTPANNPIAVETADTLILGESGERGLGGDLV